MPEAHGMQASQDTCGLQGHNPAHTNTDQSTKPSKNSQHITESSRVPASWKGRPSPPEIMQGMSLQPDRTYQHDHQTNGHQSRTVPEEQLQTR